MMSRFQFVACGRGLASIFISSDNKATIAKHTEQFLVLIFKKKTLY